PRAGHRVRGAAQRRGDAEATMLVLVGVGVPAPLEDVLDRDQALEDALLVHHRQLLDAVFREDPFRLVERRADRRRDEPLLRHRGADRAVGLALALQVAGRGGAPQAPAVSDGRGAGDAGAHVHVPGMHARVPRNEQHVVEGESRAGAEGSHGESYRGGGGSSTFSAGFLAASSTAAFPAAATFSSSFPALPTASIVPRMMLTGTRPARNVSSSVSATLWNGAAPAGRSAYFDSRNS